MIKLAKQITDLIGNTPLLELCNYEKNNRLAGRIIAKLEFFNPLSSVKDRVGYAMIKAAEEKGIIKKGAVIIEPTSGNTGIALAFVGASRGYKVILTMPDTMSIERKKILKQLGAEIVLTPGGEGMIGAIEKAKELAASIPNSYMPLQFQNTANPAVHRKKTAMEIWRDTHAKVDIFVAGVGSGGTITGVGEALKEKNPDIKVIAVEPAASPMLSKGFSGPHNIQGIGANFMPEILNINIYDEIIQVTNEEAIQTAKKVAKEEGLLVGISSGAALYAATVIAKRAENEGKMIVVLFPDTGERYLSTELFD